ncbi:MAG: NADPH:quinone reductase-like Zn-dependent oxidoreductase [Myxococcota bacterium]|jgi:NADPH:quinone reductase-like Zn-dependent oxidoreductase
MGTAAPERTTFVSDAVMMRAARIHAYGGADQFKIESIPRPEVRPNDVLIQIHASSINPIDYKMRSGAQRAVIRRKLPTTLGMDVSGVVAAVGADVTAFNVGDAVFSSPTHKRDGTYAEYVAVDAAEVAMKPTSITHVEAASLPLVGLTAWGCLVDAGKLKPGQTVLIQAGAGGVGTFAIQLAKHRGATVATTCSARNEALVRSLGADIVVDYNKARYEEVLEPQDVVLEALGGEHIGRGIKTLKRGGTLASINSGIVPAAKRYGAYLGILVVAFGIAWMKLKAKFTKGASASVVVRASSGEKLAQIAALVDAGKIRPVIDRQFPLDAIAEAHGFLETGRAQGKVIIEVISEDSPVTS